MSERFTSTVPDELADEIPFEEFESKSGAIVHHVERGLEADEIEEELKELRTERDNLRRQLQAANSRMDDVQELVEYVEEERSLQTRREQRRDAPIWTRAKWWVLGRDRDDNETSDKSA
jgi:predicted nuclease with TOPRIM domain